MRSCIFRGSTSIQIRSRDTHATIHGNQAPERRHVPRTIRQRATRASRASFTRAHATFHSATEHHPLQPTPQVWAIAIRRSAVELAIAPAMTVTHDPRDFETLLDTVHSGVVSSIAGASVPFLTPFDGTSWAMAIMNHCSIASSQATWYVAVTYGP